MTERDDNLRKACAYLNLVLSQYTFWEQEEKELLLALHTLERYKG